MFTIGIESESDAVGRIGVWDCVLCIRMEDGRSSFDNMTLTSTHPI